MPSDQRALLGVIELEGQSHPQIIFLRSIINLVSPPHQFLSIGGFNRIYGLKLWMRDGELDLGFRNVVAGFKRFELNLRIFNLKQDRFQI